MSKTNKKHRTPIYRRPIIWVIAIIGILAVIALVIIFYHPNQTNQVDNPNPITPPSAQSDPNLSSGNQDQNTSSDSQTVNEPEDKTIQFEGGNPNDANELTGVIAYKGVDQGTLYVAVTIDQYVSGTCALTLTGRNTSRTLTISTPAVADVQSSACQTFEISTRDLPRDTYTIEIKLNSNDKSGIIRDEVEL